ncbi:MAG: hypothetical protein GX951_04930 [Mollicutes bacterium]|nr:hypothetical protein [Mollicutes bacterium]
MKKWIKFFFILLLIIPLSVFALSKEYKDYVYDIVGIIPEENKINIYFFHKDGCNHCAAEENWLENLKEEYEDSLNIYEYEVISSEKNFNFFKEVCQIFNKTTNSVPVTIIGDNFYSGFSEVTISQMEAQIKEYLEEEVDKNIVTIPIIGKVNVKEVSLPLVAIVLGFLDGFNPCAMWVLIFLINMLFNMKDKKKMWLLGFVFLFVSALVYFLSMIGINLVLSIPIIQKLKNFIAIFIIIAGLYNLKKYIETRKEDVGCHIVNDKKRKKIFKRINDSLKNKNYILSIIGITLLAASVNLVELACTFGFPLVYSEILSINNITGFVRILYLLICVAFYIIDDLLVFIISMLTLEVTGITNKYSKICILISGIIMIIMGVLLIVKPEWLTFGL